MTRLWLKGAQVRIAPEDALNALTVPAYAGIIRDAIPKTALHVRCGGRLVYGPVPLYDLRSDPREGRPAGWDLDIRLPHTNTDQITVHGQGPLQLGLYVTLAFLREGGPTNLASERSYPVHMHRVRA